MLAFMISPERGSLTLGPYAFSIVDGSQRIVELRASSRSKLGSSVGATFAVSALLNPAARNTGSHISRPLISHGTHFTGLPGCISPQIRGMGRDNPPYASFRLRP